MGTATGARRRGVGGLVERHGRAGERGVSNPTERVEQRGVLRVDCVFELFVAIRPFGYSSCSSLENALSLALSRTATGYISPIESRFTHSH